MWESVRFSEAGGGPSYSSPRQDLMDRAYRLGKVRAALSFVNSDSQSCSTTSAELSPGIREGMTKRWPSAETSNETGE